MGIPTVLRDDSFDTHCEAELAGNYRQAACLLREAVVISLLDEL
jgi:hypothetical protein